VPGAQVRHQFGGPHSNNNAPLGASVTEYHQHPNFYWQDLPKVHPSGECTSEECTCDAPQYSLPAHAASNMTPSLHSSPPIRPWLPSHTPVPDPHTLQALVTLAKIFQSFRVDLEPGVAPLKVSTGLTMAPEHGIHVRAYRL
jgi:hypothetical protein